MRLLLPYGCLILLHIWLELYVFSVFTICNSPVDCRMVQFHIDCSVTPASFSSDYCFLLSDVQVQSNKAETLWTWHVDVLLSVWEWGNVAKLHCWALMWHHNFPVNINPKTGQISQVTARSSCIECVKVQAVATVQVTELWCCFAKWISWTVSLCISGSCSWLIAWMLGEEIIVTPL